MQIKWFVDTTFIPPKLEKCDLHKPMMVKINKFENLLNMNSHGAFEEASCQLKHN